MLKNIYYSLLYSHLVYAIQVWGSACSSEINKILVLQKRAIRIITHNNTFPSVPGPLHPTAPVFYKLEILKVQYYRKFFDSNKCKMSSIWKGIRQIVNINNTSKKDVMLLNNKGKKVTDPRKIAKLFNDHYASVGRNIDKKIPKPLKKFHDYLRNIHVSKSFFLNPASPQEIFDIILSYDTKKALGPNSIPIYILKISNNFLSNVLAEIINLAFKTGIFPDLCKLAKIIPIFKKDDSMLCINYRPISLLSIYSKIFEKLIYFRMYYFLNKNNLIYDKQFGFRAKHSVNHALISTTELIKDKL